MFFPNFNVPPPDFEPQCLPHTDFDAQIALFLKKHNLEPKNYPNKEMLKKLKLSDVQIRMTNIEKLKNDEKKLIVAMNSNLNDFSEAEWQTKVLETENLRKKFDLETNFLTENRQKIQKLIKKRQNKRKSQKRTKKLQKETLKQILENRQKKHLEIDQNLKQINEKFHAEKQAALEKEETKTTLSLVHKKIREAREKLELFENLLKLREIRKQQAQRPELDVTEDIFIEEIDRMKKLWVLALEQHLDEEQKLQEYLDEKFKQQKTVEQQWKEVIFGAEMSGSKKIDHPLLKAERNLEAFLGVRREWDACIADDGSLVPLFWVLPTDNEQWQLYK